MTNQLALMSMFSTYDSTVNSLYLAFYGRPADPAGLKFWSQALAANNGDAGAIIGAFATSQEAQTRFGSDDVGARIIDIYEQLFNRAPDAAGLAYWTGAVESGNATLAEVSVAILNGAQGSDQTLSTLRQKAADAFTAAVESGATQYSGYASIEAARVLVRAVTADATEADLAKLVKAAVSFADTATKNPKVVDAIATGSTLLNLYDSARGLKDPVALTQALADTAKAAAGDPVTLESLLRGGGMDKVLKVMPTKATLTDVVEALAKGGLPAAVEVVYPTAPAVKPPPSKPMVLTYDSVSQGEFDSDTGDNVTNMPEATVKFRYTGSDLKSGQKFEFSTDGENWSSDNVSANTAIKVVTIAGVSLTGHQNLYSTHASESTVMLAAAPAQNVKTQVYLRAIDAAKNVLAQDSAQVEYDGVAPTGRIVFYDIDPAGEGSNGVVTPSSVNFGFVGSSDAIVQWRLAGANTKWEAVNVDEDGTFALTGIDLAVANQKVELRFLDAAGNIGGTLQQPVGYPLLTVYSSVDGPAVVDAIGRELQMAANGRTYSLKSAEQGNYVILGAQDEVRAGAVQMKLDNGGLAQSDTNQFVLGTNGVDAALRGGFVWGFDGDDIIDGTDSSDGLYGGAGNDTITGGAGYDTLHGGPGGDTLILTGNRAGQGDTLQYYRGDAVTRDFVDSGSTIAIDKIIGFGVNDQFHINEGINGALLLRDTYLNADSVIGDFAVVRGSDADGKFVAGSTASDDDYMVQWVDGAHDINSVILHDFGTTAPRFDTGHGLTFLKLDQTPVELVGLPQEESAGGPP